MDFQYERKKTWLLKSLKIAIFGINVLRKEKKAYTPTSQPHDYINIFLFTLLRRKPIFI